VIYAIMPPKLIKPQEDKSSLVTVTLLQPNEPKASTSKVGPTNLARSKKPSLKLGGERSKIAMLMKQVADLQRQLMLLKRSQVTKAANPVERGGNSVVPSNKLANGNSQVGSHKLQSNPSQRKAERRSSGPKESNNRHRQSKRSSTRRSAQTVEVRNSSDTREPSIATVVVKKPPLRKMPKASGVSEDVTLRRNAGKIDDDDGEVVKPIKQIHYTNVIKAQPRVGGVDIRSRNIKVPALRAVPGKLLPVVEAPKTRLRKVDEELYGFLIYTFALQARTPQVMAKMVAKAKQYLNDFCCLEFTHIELHQLIVEAVEAAMSVPTNELGVRKSLQNYDDCNIRHLHADMVSRGNLGSAGIKTSFPWNACWSGSKSVHLPRPL